MKKYINILTNKVILVTYINDIKKMNDINFEIF